MENVKRIKLHVNEIRNNFVEENVRYLMMFTIGSYANIEAANTIRIELFLAMTRKSQTQSHRIDQLH